MPKSSEPILLDERYTVGAILGEGAMGRVYEGLHTILNKPVAIKVLHRHLAADERSRKRMLREARSASMIRHPAVVEIIDFGETPKGSVFLVMERVLGQQLGSVVASEGAMPWPRAHGILRQIAGALSVAHGHGIIHRDIKPSNCIVSMQEREEDGTQVEVVKLLDFGIAKIDEESASMGGLTGTGEIMGTASYMAPELTLGTPAGVPTDVYSLGCMAYELLTGAPPFQGNTAFDVLRCHLEDAPVPPRQIVSSIPPALEALVLRAIAKKPEQRVASMAEFEAGLDAIALPGPGAHAPSVEGGMNPAGPTGTALFGGPETPGPGGTEVVDLDRLRGAAPPAAPYGASLAVPQAPAPGHAPAPLPVQTPDHVAPDDSPPVVVIVGTLVALAVAVGLGLWLALG